MRRVGGSFCLASGLGWSPAFAGRPLSLNPRALEEVAWLLGIPKQGINKLSSTLEAGKPQEVVLAWEATGTPTGKSLQLAPKVSFLLYRP